jgi:hypothetical protein
MIAAHVVKNLLMHLRAETQSELDGSFGSDCMATMRIKLLSVVAISVLTFALAGCVNTVDGRKEVGIPLIKDRVVRVYERPVLQVWAAAKDVLNATGTIFSEDVMQSTVSAHVDARVVRVKVESLDPKTTRMTVQCRTKAGGTDLDLAGEVDKQIAIRLATGQLSPVTAPNAK